METELLSAILAELRRPRPTIPLDVALWDADAVAEYLSCDRLYVLKHLATRPDWPPTIRLAGPKTARWRAREVISWAQRRADRGTSVRHQPATGT
jgi:predicted DNA-binding transcriptional regulator AlpA